MALSDCAKQLTWTRNLLSEIGFNIDSIPLYADNIGSLFMGQNSISEKRTKHIDIKFHHVRQEIEEKRISLYYVESKDNVADILTKNLRKNLFDKHFNSLGLTPIKNESSNSNNDSGGMLKEQ